MERYKKLMGIKKGKDMIELPPIPEGDRFKDTSLFRPLGTGQKSRLYECWDDAIYEYARTHGDKRAAEAREQMRDECEIAINPHASYLGDEVIDIIKELK